MRLEDVGPFEDELLPEGWHYAFDEGQTWVVSPAGRGYDRCPQGYCAADIAVFDALLDKILTHLEGVTT